MAEQQQPASQGGFQSEDRYRLLVESVSDYAIFMLDTQGIVRSWNRGAERFKGYKPDEIIGKHYSTFYPPEALAEEKPKRLLKLALEQGHIEDEGWRVKKDGTRFWADVVITPLYDAAGQHVGFSKVTRDLTERKRAEDQRRQFELLVKSVSDYAILMMSPEGRIISWNKGAEFLKGYSEAEIIGQPYERFFLPEDVERGKPQRLLALARERGHIEDEGWRMKKDGSRFWAQAVITAIHDEKGEFIGYGKVTRDLTERKRMEALNAKMLQLEAANKLKSEFLANMSHELRTPLNSIIGYTELVMTDPDHPPDELGQNNLQTVLRNARHLLALINEVLDLSKIEAGQTTVHAEPFDPQQTLQAVINTARPLAEEKGLALNLHIEPGIELVVSDETKLRQILINLVGNAVKFTDAGSVEVTLAPKADAEWTVAVRDTGIGIAPENHDLVFQEFRQVDASSTRAKGGTGLGLAISRKLAELLEGSLTLESVPGQGSTFTLTLPRQTRGRFEPAPRPQAAGPKERSPGRAEDGRPIVLAIDDEPEALHIVAEKLKGAGYHVVTATSAESGLSLARQLQPFAITLDVMMPKMDGWMALRQLKADPATRDIPVIFLSFLDNKGLAYSLGAAEFLSKPLNRDDLVAVLNRLSGAPEEERV